MDKKAEQKRKNREAKVKKRREGENYVIKME